MSITLYAAKMSSASPVVHAVKELEAPVEIVWLELAKNEQRKPEFLALNPNGKVPTLVVDGAPMFEALAIMCYLGERFGVERGLWPAANTGERLRALSWATWAYVTYGAQLVRLIFSSSERLPRELLHAPQAEASRSELHQLLAILDAELAERPFLLGNAFSLVDLIVGSTITYGTYVGATIEGHDHVATWLERLHSRPAFRETWGT